jgi:sRNA-binding carbon storage regulator CsrA
MLVLTRQTGGSEDERTVKIIVPPADTDTVVTVRLVRIKSSRQCQIGFEAPKEVVILRADISEKH